MSLASVTSPFWEKKSRSRSSPTYLGKFFTHSRDLKKPTHHETASSSSSSPATPTAIEETIPKPTSSTQSHKEPNPNRSMANAEERLEDAGRAKGRRTHITPATPVTIRKCEQPADVHRMAELGYRRTQYAGCSPDSTGRRGQLMSSRAGNGSTGPRAGANRQTRSAVLRSSCVLLRGFTRSLPTFPFLNGGARQFPF